ncbi:MAG: helix-turn-helix transcriptional regulator [Bacilli bacterium]|nr:helix-turn-helix transcriptional regulator [Bacilli bacterium]
MNFGENLRILRKSSKLSQETLAEKMGVTRQSISKWEVGDAYPEMSNIVALCTIFHCNINDLINDNIIDVDLFDKETKEGIVKFKINQQKNMKRVSKSIYIISNICRIILGIPTLLSILACIIFPVISRHIIVNDNNITIYNKVINYTISDNVIEINGNKHYIESSTDIASFVKNHDTKFYIISAEYVLVSMTVLSVLTVLFMHNLYKLYKNMYEKDTPFTIENERLVNKVCMILFIQLILSKVTALIYSIVAKLDLTIEFNIKDVIMVLVAISIIYIFKYGRLLQADSKSKIYGE